MKFVVEQFGQEVANVAVLKSNLGTFPFSSPLI